MSALNNTIKQNNLVPKTIRNKVYSLVYNNKLQKEYEDLCLEDFKNKIEKNYINLSNKSLKYKVFNLMGMTDNNGSHIYNINGFKKYISYINSNDGLTPSNTIIEDLLGEYLFNIDKFQSAKNFAKVKYIEHYNKNKLKVFITFTNPSEYHFLKNSGTTKNHKCKFNTLEETIEESIKLQIKINRYFYNQLKKYLKRAGLCDNVNYIRQLEAHSNLCAHSHSLYFLDKNALEIIEHIYEQVMEKFNLKECKLEVITEDTMASTYVVKYIIKSMNNENVDENFHNHYKRYYSKYRFFTSSNYKYTNQQELNKTYSYLKKNNPKLIERFNNSSTPLYVLLEKYIKQKLKFEYEEVEVKSIDYNAINEFIKDYRYVSDLIGEENFTEVSNFKLFQHIIKHINTFRTKHSKRKKIRYLKCKHTNNLLKDYHVPIIQKLSVNQIINWYKGS